MANTTTEVSTSSQANSSSSSPKAAPPAPAESQQRRTIATYAVLVGLTPLIPVPFVDDVVEGALVRRFVGALSASRGVTLSDAEVRALSFGSDGGVFKKIARGVFVYPLKKLFRKTFFFLEGKRV